MKQFETISVRPPARSVHDLSFEKKTTVKMGQLVPILVQEVLPSDSMRIRTESLIRFFPTLAPIMHRVDAYIHYFFVPNRIIWDEWEEFITGGKEGTSMPNVPKIADDVSGLSNMTIFSAVGSLADQMGFPVNQLPVLAVMDDTQGFEISQLPFRAYQRIWNDYYRDSNLQDEIDIPIDSVNVSASGSAALVTMRYRNWEKDYFTTCLPNTQLGDAVLLPLGTYAPVVSWADAGNSYPMPAANVPKFVSYSSGAAGTGAVAANSGNLTMGGVIMNIDPNGGMFADLQNAEAASINDLRRSFAVQRWMEKNMRGGHRYFEQMASHFGIKTPDQRLQRPEYLGGGKIHVQVSEVMQTSETNTSSEFNTAQGSLAGNLYAVGANASAQAYFLEHGFIIGLLSVMPRTGYMQGLPRIFTKDDRFDYYWPEFANLGEEAVLNSEIYAVGKDYEEIFGYLPRYQDYRFNFDQVSGAMRDSLDFWHLARKFDNEPTLSSQFVTCLPSNRIFPIEDGSYDHLLVQLYHDIKAIRPVAKWGTPI